MSSPPPPRRIKRSVVTREHRSAHGASQAMQSVTPVTIAIVMVVTLLSFFYCSLANQILGMFYCLRLDSHAGSPVSGAAQAATSCLPPLLLHASTVNPEHDLPITPVAYIGASRGGRGPQQI
jgi:hypothetical protein